LDPLYCDEVPVIICENVDDPFFYCNKWYEYDSIKDTIGQPAHFFHENGTCPKNLPNSATVQTETPHRKPVSTATEDSGIEVTVWRWTFVAVAIVTVIVIVWSVVSACRKHNVFDKVRHHNRTVVSADDEEEGSDEETSPKTKAPPPPKERQTKHDPTEYASEKLISDKPNDDSDTDKSE